jgi:hypothetical protein
MEGRLYPQASEAGPQKAVTALLEPRRENLREYYESGMEGASVMVVKDGLNLRQSTSTFGYRIE